jgi:hypothetical protein
MSGGKSGTFLYTRYRYNLLTAPNRGKITRKLLERKYGKKKGKRKENEIV